MADTTSAKVEEHYRGGGGLRDRLRSALTDQGLDPDHLELDDLAMVEEFHSMGRQGTIQLADVAKIAKGERVLDVGCGIGGPARVLAKQYGAHVTGIDLTADYCDTATMLSASTGLSDSTEFRQANALDLPFDDGSFDVVWSQHASMNIADKGGLYQEMRRVVRDGGRLAFFDIVDGPEDPVEYPVPWADGEATSFLIRADDLLPIVEAAGFRPTAWNDLRPAALEWLDSLPPGGPPPGALGIHLLLPDLPARVQAYGKNLRENRVGLLQAVCDAI